MDRKFEGPPFAFDYKGGVETRIPTASTAGPPPN